ncbi:MAG: 7TM domain-containing protein [Candidatus Gracilibacteria bacterium]
MKYALLLTSFFLAFSLQASPILAQDIAPTVSTIDLQNSISPIITGKSEIEIGKRLYLDAGSSSVPQNTPLQYIWTINDQSTQEGKETFYTFDTPGEYTISLTIKSDTASKTVMRKIFVYREMVSFLYNGPLASFTSNIQSAQELAKNNGIFLNLIQGDDGSPILTEDAVYRALSGKLDSVKNSQTLIAGPYPTDVLPALNKLGYDQDSEGTHVIILTTNEPIWLFNNVIARLSRLVDAKELILIQQDPFAVLNFFLQSTDIEHFKQKLPEKDYAIISKNTSPGMRWALLSQGLNKAIENGIPASVLSFLLIVPLILTWIAFFKQVIGIETFGLLKTLILVLSFYILGIKYGSFILLYVILMGVLIRIVLSKFTLFYIPKVTLTLSFATLAVLGLIIIGSYFNLTFGIDTSSGQRALLSLVPMLLIAFQADTLSYHIFTKNSNYKELLILLATYFEVVIAFGIARIDYLRYILFALPELIIIVFILQFLISRYTGLRAIEVFRFRELLLQDLEE